MRALTPQDTETMWAGAAYMAGEREPLTRILRQQSPCLYADVIARLRAEGWSEGSIQREVRSTFRRGKT